MTVDEFVIARPVELPPQVEEVVTRRPIRVMVMPRDPNPYQELLHAELASRDVTSTYVGELTPSRTLNLLLLPAEIAVMRARGYRLLHVHWLYHFDLRPGLPLPGVRWLAALLLRLVLLTCRLAGVRVVWTAHNVLPHAQVFANDVNARRLLVRRSEVVVAHSGATLAALADLGLKPQRWLLAPHPAYPVPRTRARKQPAGTHFVLAGGVATHKGVDELLAAFVRVADPTARLTIAGRCNDLALERRLLAAAAEDSRITLRLARLSDDELVEVLRSASYVVLPYRAVTTSGLAMLALSAGRPLIVPDLPGFADLPDATAMRYDATEPNALGDALREATAEASSGLTRRRRAAAGFAATRTWRSAGYQVWRAYLLALDHRRTPAGPVARLRGLGQRVLGGGELESTATNLLLNLVLGSFTGFAATIVLTHVFTASQVGLGSVAISLAGVAATFSQLGLDYSILRFLPNADDPEQIINATITIGALVTVAVSGGLLLIPSASGRLIALGATTVTLVFLFGTLMSALQQQLELILIAKQQARAVWRLNIPANLSKLVFPFAFVSLGAIGVYVSQIAAITVSVALMAYALARAGVRYRPSLNVRATAELWRFSIGAFVAGLAGSAPLYLLPLVIVARFGSQNNAYWFASMAIAMALYQVASSISQALLSHASRSPQDRRQILFRGARLTFLIMLPALAAAYLAAPWALVLFGHHYSVAATAVLRWLIISGLAVSLNFVTGAVLYLDKRTGLITAINVVNAVVVLGLATVVATNLVQVGAAWAAGELSNVVLFSASSWWALHRRGGRWELLGESV